jgi:transcription elongation factor S-II
MYSNLNDKRKKVVEELAKALEQSVNASISTFLAYNIEGSINKFKPLDRDGKGYFDKAKSLIFNLKRNERRRQELAEGYLTADELINLSPTELATDELRSSREKDKLAASWERRTDFYIATRDERLKSNGIDPAAGGEFQCRKCKSTKCTHYALQTRSSDEPMTVFVCCLGCGNQWRC